ncbi:MAG: hypothetical protein WA703_05155, partial [Pseudolabrys sp.]
SATGQFRPDYNQTGVNSDTDGDFRKVLALKFGVEFVQAVIQLKRGTHRTLGIVFMGSRIPEINEHAVAAELRDKAAITLHYRQGEPLVLQLQIPQIFGIQLFRQLSVPHKVAKKDR